MKKEYLLLLLALILVGACFGGGPADTIKDFYANVEAGKLDAAVEHLSATTRSQISDSKMKQVLQEATRDIDRKGGVEKFEIVEEKVIGEIAEVTVKMTYGNGSSETETSSLIKESGKWRIQSSGK